MARNALERMKKLLPSKHIITSNWTEYFIYDISWGCFPAKFIHSGWEKAIFNFLRQYNESINRDANLWLKSTSESERVSIHNE